MAITAALCNSYKQEILSGVHLDTHDYRIALFTAAATLDEDTASYTGLSDEVPDGSGYTEGGQLLVGFSTSLDGSTAILDWSTDPEWTSASFTARGALIYNDSLPGKNAVCVLDFGSNKSPSSGTFTLVLPAPTSAAGLIRIGECDVEPSTDSATCEWLIEKATGYPFPGFQFLTNSFDSTNSRVSATVLWPDGSPGSWSRITKNTIFNTESSWIVSHEWSGSTVMQPEITYDEWGGELVKPELVCTGAE